MRVGLAWCRSCCAVACGVCVLLMCEQLRCRYEEYVPRKRRREEEEAKLLRLRGVSPCGTGHALNCRLHMRVHQHQKHVQAMAPLGASRAAVLHGTMHSCRAGTQPELGAGGWISCMLLEDAVKQAGPAVIVVCCTRLMCLQSSHFFASQHTSVRLHCTLQALQTLVPSHPNQCA